MEGSLNEPLEKRIGIGCWIVDDLPTQKAIFRCNVAFDVSYSNSGVSSNIEKELRQKYSSSTPDRDNERINAYS
ncbi:hypothetical protein MTBBW1_720001 [Desulfamplus magnetovallimortis]|uniref:Uncharacterized protein n=1 Tax=Desulfamplus magnetovallimortis TaxID=1246637 RepID=A0A1W1HIW7_9BACT|nr:hypothetical protein MTBBW1_720001 [Desulfamplus magnetovallimortis]